MSYEQKPLRRYKALYNSTNAQNALTYQLVVDGAKVTPTSGAITIYKATSATAILASTAMTVSGSKLTYAPDTTTVATWPIGSDFQARLAIVYSGVTYDRVVQFDVVRWLLDVQLGVDQLISVDDQVRGMTVNDDDDMSNLIESCRDDLQLILESKMLKEKKLLENTILDQAKVGAVFKYYVLAQLFFMKGQTERSDKYEKRFWTMLNAMLSTLNFDAAQDGAEDADEGGVQEVRLVT